jgi:hypothetical protein
MDFYDRGRLHAFAGYAAIAAGEDAVAADHLVQALADTGLGAKQRVVVLADLACAHRNDGDRAAQFLHQAVDELERDWYNTGLDRIRSVRPMLGDGRLGVELDERIAALGVDAPTMG